MFRAPNLEDVGILAHDVDVDGVKYLGDDRQAGALAGVGQ